MDLNLAATKIDSKGHLSYFNSLTHENSLIKTKKYGKAISKKQKTKKRSNDWTIQQNNIYARLLLHILMNNIQLECIFTQILMSKINRNPQQIYCYHKKMLSQHRTIQQIIIYILGTRFQKTKTREKDCKAKNNSQLENDSNSDKHLQQNEISYLQRLMLSDCSPQKYEIDEDMISTKIFELHNFQYWQQQQNTQNSFENQSCSQESIQIQVQGEDDTFLQT